MSYLSVLRVIQCMQALRQASDASDVMFSLELSHNVHSKDTLSRHPSETVEVLQGAPSSDVADLQRLRRLARPPNDFEMQVKTEIGERVCSDMTLRGLDMPLALFPLVPLQHLNAVLWGIHMIS